MGERGCPWVTSLGKYPPTGRHVKYSPTEWPWPKKAYPDHCGLKKLVKKKRRPSRLTEEAHPLHSDQRKAGRSRETLLSDIKVLAREAICLHTGSHFKPVNERDPSTDVLVGMQTEVLHGSLDTPGCPQHRARSQAGAILTATLKLQGYSRDAHGCRHDHCFPVEQLSCQLRTAGKPCEEPIVLGSEVWDLCVVGKMPINFFNESEASKFFQHANAD